MPHRLALKQLNRPASRPPDLQVAHDIVVHRQLARQHLRSTARRAGAAVAGGRRAEGQDMTQTSRQQPTGDAAGAAAWHSPQPPARRLTASRYSRISSRRERRPRSPVTMSPTCGGAQRWSAAGRSWVGAQRQGSGPAGCPPHSLGPRQARNSLRNCRSFSTSWLPVSPCRAHL